MPAKDTFHDFVKQSLVNEGWTITHDPFYLQTGGIEIYIDLGAERILAAEKGEKKIAVEIKCFLEPSFIASFHLAVGQYINYRTALSRVDKDRILFLAIPSDIYKSFFIMPFSQNVINDNYIKFFVFDLQTGEIVKWIE